MDNTDLYSRDYDVRKLQDEIDPRFRIARKECIFTQGLWWLQTGATLFLAYQLCPEDVADMTYILGFPAWVFAGLAVSALATLVMVVWCLKFIKQFSLDARLSETGQKEVRK